MTNKLSEKDLQILNLLKDFPQGATLSQVQRFAEIKKKEYALYFLKKLIRKELVARKDHLYFRTATQAPAIVKPTYHHKPKGKPASQPIRTRLHNFGLGYPLKDPISPKEAPILLTRAGYKTKPIRLKNNEQGEIVIGNMTLRLHTKGLNIYSKEIYTDNLTSSIDLEATLKPVFDEIALEVEASLAKTAPFKLMRIDKDTLFSRILKQHYAEEHHPIAEASPESPLILAKHPLDKQKRLGVDMSKGFREFEFYHKLTANVDKDTIDSQFNELLDGRISLSDIPRLKEVVLGQEERYNRQFELVDRFTRQVSLHLRIMKKIDEKLNQRRLNP